MLTVNFHFISLHSSSCVTCLGFLFCIISGRSVWYLKLTLRLKRQSQLQQTFFFFFWENKSWYSDLFAFWLYQSTRDSHHWYLMSPKIKSGILNIFSSCFLLYFVNLGTHMYKFCEPQRQGCEYMKPDSQVKKSPLIFHVNCLLGR